MSLMLFGFVGAAIAGFLLTALADWTGRRPPLTGPGLFGPRADKKPSA